MEATSAGPSRWSGAWLDAVGFLTGLGLAWSFRWETRDLVWSLWLSSLVVGYAMILWTLFTPAVALARAGRGGQATFLAVGGVLLLAFFTFHFGMFHFVHAVFLNAFFPMGPKGAGFNVFSVFGEVVARYGWFVPAALLAERQIFRLPAPPPGPTDSAGNAGPFAAFAQRKGQRPLGDGLMKPYVNVVRLHLLIFFFAGAHFARIDHFAVYAVVYAVYFFPWRRLRREGAGAQAPATP